MSQALLKIDSIRVKYGAIEALRGVSLEVFKGEVVALIGANGAGKSTLLMSLFSNPKPYSGSILYKDTRLDKVEQHQVSSLGIAISPEGRRVFPKMTVEENLIIGANSLGDNFIEEDKTEIFSLFPILGQRRNQSAGTLSGGEQQMLAIGRAMMSRPELLLLDEPSLGIAPLVSKQIFATIKEIAAQGTTVFFVEQNAYAALKLADRAYVLVNGLMSMSGKASELLENPEIRDAYLAGH